jgi:hypothetical protein
MNSALELEPAIGAFSLEHHNNFFKAAETSRTGRQNLNAPAARFSVARIHPVKLAGKECGFVTARAGTNLDNDVFAVVGIFRQDQILETGFQLFLTLSQSVNLFFGELSYSLIVFFKELTVLLDLLLNLAPFTVRDDDLLQFGSLLGQLRIFPLQVGKGRIRHQAFELFVTLFNFCQFIKHKM